MSEVVIDASAALAFVLPTQSSPAADDFLAKRGDHRFIAPYVFPWEIGNALIGLSRRGLAWQDDELSVGRLLGDLAMSLERPLAIAEVIELEAMARHERLRLFDAAYLSLAIEKGCPLASRDARLLQVARLYVPTFNLLGEALS